MKIIFLLPHLRISGGNRIALNYANGLSKLGYEVAVVTVSKRFFRRLFANILKSRFFKLNWFKNFKPKILRVKSLDENNLPEHDRVVACDYVSAGKMNKYNISDKNKIHLIMHDERLYHGKKEDVEEVYRYKNKKVVISTWLKEIVKKDFNQDSLLLVAPVDVELFHKVEIEKKSDEIRILMLYHTYEWKGIKEGMEALEYIKSKHKNIKLVLFGVRKEKPDIECDEYHYNLPQEKLAELYSSCDIFLCPSWYEGLGMPAMEAMACGSCVVTFDTGGSRDYAFDGETAFVAKHRDVEDLKSKLDCAISSSDTRIGISENGKLFVLQSMDNWKKSVDIFNKYIINK